MTMSPALNLPLAFAALVTLWLDQLVLLQPEISGDAVSRGIVVFPALIAAALRWLCVTLVTARCAARGRLGFLPVSGVPFWCLHCLAGGLSGVCLLVAASSSKAVAGHDFANMSAPVLVAARIGSTVPPVLVIALLLLVVNAGLHRVSAGQMRAAAAAAVLLCLGGGAPVLASIASADAADRRRTAMLRHEADVAREADLRQRFAMLSDTDPLLSWNTLVGADVPPDHPLAPSGCS